MIPRLKPYHKLSDLGRLRYWEKELESTIRTRIQQLTDTRACLLFPYARSAIYHLTRAFADHTRQVATTAYSCVAVPNAIVQAGASPNWIDIDLADGNQSPQELDRALRRAPCDFVLLTHLYGNTADIGGLLDVCRKHNIRYVFTDAALALDAYYQGTHVSALTQASVLSFSVGKHLSCLNGGALVSQDSEIIRQVSSLMPEPTPATSGLRKLLFYISLCSLYELRLYPVADYLFNHTSVLQLLARHIKPSGIQLPGDCHSRLSGFQQRVLLDQLDRWPQIREQRRKLQEQYQQTFGKSLLTNDRSRENTLSHAVIRHSERDRVYQRTRKWGIYLEGALFEYALPDLPQFANFYQPCPNASRLGAEAINLPLYPDAPQDLPSKILSLFSTLDSLPAGLTFPSPLDGKNPAPTR